VGEEDHTSGSFGHAQVPFEFYRTDRDPNCTPLAPVFRFSFHNLVSVATLGVIVVGLSHLSTTRALEQLSDLLLRNLLKVLVPVVDG